MRLIPFAVGAACGVTLSAHQGWRDPSKHDARLVTVDQGVQLEVLDWGGSGPALVLLTGSGHTAHVVRSRAGCTCSMAARRADA